MMGAVIQHQIKKMQALSAATSNQMGATAGDAVMVASYLVVTVIGMIVSFLMLMEVLLSALTLVLMAIARLTTATLDFEEKE